VHSGLELHVMPTQSGNLRQAHAGLKRDQQHGMITASIPCLRIRHGEQRLDFGSRKKTNWRSIVSFGRDCEDLLNAPGVLWLIVESEAHSNADCDCAH
jgi:hypothetical protein